MGRYALSSPLVTVSLPLFGLQVDPKLLYTLTFVKSIRPFEFFLLHQKLFKSDSFIHVMLHIEANNTTTV